jgi:hypothetical protein
MGEINKESIALLHKIDTFFIKKEKSNIIIEFMKKFNRC